jgi:uncharacterized membrane protein YeiH
MPHRAAPFVLIADLGGTALFAAEGAAAGMRAGLDLMGLGVLAIVTAIGGGVMRDVLLGDAPPAALRDSRYLIAALAGSAVTLAWPGLVAGGTGLLVIDAAALSLFAVAGSEKALDFQQGALTAALLGTLTATGGGLLRDVLLVRIPAILRVDFYATAALAGAIALIVMRRAGMRPGLAAVGAGLVCCGLRVIGAGLHWRLPVFSAP